MAQFTGSPPGAKALSGQEFDARQRGLTGTATAAISLRVT
jgi:hypothetical protein